MNIQKYIVVNKEIVAEGIAVLFLTLADGSIPKYRPGQYLKVYFPELTTFKGKEYSISSAPEEGNMSITVRAIGRFSNLLYAMKIGDTFSASLPSGMFNLEDQSSDLVMIAGGMGVTPFRGIIYNSLKKSPQYKIALFHSVRNTNDLLFKTEFSSLESKHESFQVNSFLTRESSDLAKIHHRRIEIKDILQSVKDPKKVCFMICGSTSFNASYRKGLVNIGISRENIYSETLF